MTLKVLATRYYVDAPSCLLNFSGWPGFRVWQVFYLFPCQAASCTLDVLFCSSGTFCILGSAFPSSVNVNRLRHVKGLVGCFFFLLRFQLVEQYTERHSGLILSPVSVPKSVFKVQKASFSQMYASSLLQLPFTKGDQPHVISTSVEFTTRVHI